MMSEELKPFIDEDGNYCGPENNLIELVSIINYYRHKSYNEQCCVTDYIGKLIFKVLQDE